MEAVIAEMWRYSDSNSSLCHEEHSGAVPAGIWAHMLCGRWVKSLCLIYYVQARTNNPYRIYERAEHVYNETISLDYLVL